MILVLAASAARADEAPASQPAPPDVETAPVHVRGAREDAAWAAQAARALDEPAFVTEVSVDERRGETRSAAEALAETVGVSVRSLGGLGAFASISMRGAPSGQTEILIDGVPLSRLAFSSIDVGSLDLDGFDRVDIYRGGVPVALGGAALGGAVDFVTRVGPSASGAHDEITLGGGSFGARRVRVARGDAFGDLKTALTAAYSGASGDFSYFDDNGTPLNPADDASRDRQNDGYDALDLAARAEAPRASGGARFAYKDQGVPGPTGARATQTRLTTTRVLVDGTARVVRSDDGAFGLSARGYGVLEAQRFQDPLMEAGLSPADTRFLTLAGGAAVALDYLAAPGQRWSLALDGRVERFTQRDERAADPDASEVSGQRLGAGLSLADEIVLGADDTLVLIPAIRGDVLVTRGDGPPSPYLGNQPPGARDDGFLSPRLGARWRLAQALTLKGNVGRYFRPPTVVELFGDRGFVGGNAGLRPESGTTADLGVVVAADQPAGPADRLYLELAGFAAAVDDLIAFLPTSGRVIRAANVGTARILGVEAAVAARFFHVLALTGNYTLLDTRQISDHVSEDGRQLPGRPRHQLYLRADLRGRVGDGRFALGGFADLTLVSGNYLDTGNLDEVPARRFVGLGVQVSPVAGLTLTAEVKNLLDARTETVDSAVGPVPRALADALDYPLPGRAFYATADWRF
jgi:iron complex outermembrane receptor protein